MLASKCVTSCVILFLLSSVLINAHWVPPKSFWDLCESKVLQETPKLPPEPYIFSTPTFDSASELRSMAIVGDYHTGTNFQQLLLEQFSNLPAPEGGLLPELGKHVCQASANHLDKVSRLQSKHLPRLIVVCLRNPLDWFLSMHSRVYHEYACGHQRTFRQFMEYPFRPAVAKVPKNGSYTCSGQIRMN